jgi:aquaporin Z
VAGRNASDSGRSDAKPRAEAARRNFLIRVEEDVLDERPLWIRLIVEFLGSAMLVTVAAGAGVIDRYAGGNQVPRAAAVAAPGALIVALIYAWGPLSGVHLNPAVTLAFSARRVFDWAWAGPYVIVQFGGALLASLFLQLIYGHVSAGGNYPIDRPGGDWRALVMEIILTTILITVILNTATGYRNIGHNAALAVGATIIADGLFAGPISGASMNPARTLAPDIVANDYTGWWVYIAGPLVGAAIAVALIDLLRGSPTSGEEASAEGGALPLSMDGKGAGTTRTGTRGGV